MFTHFSKSTKDFWKWFLITKNVDSIILGMVLTVAVSGLIKTFNTSTVTPVINFITNIDTTDSTRSQRFRLFGRDIEFKFHLLLNSFVQFILYTFIVYVMTTLVRKVEKALN